VVPAITNMIKITHIKPTLASATVAGFCFTLRGIIFFSSCFTTCCVQQIAMFNLSGLVMANGSFTPILTEFLN
jgi:hypothetical protein